MHAFSPAVAVLFNTQVSTVYFLSQSLKNSIHSLKNSICFYGRQVIAQQGRLRNLGTLNIITNISNSLCLSAFLCMRLSNVSKDHVFLPGHQAFRGGSAKIFVKFFVWNAPFKSNLWVQKRQNVSKCINFQFDPICLSGNVSAAEPKPAVMEWIRCHNESAIQPHSTKPTEIYSSNLQKRQWKYKPAKYEPA